MDYSLYFSPFLSAFLIAVSILSLFFFGRKFLPEKRFSARHIHKKGVSRLGGVALIVAFSFALLLDKNLFIPISLQAVLVASSFILLIGVWDDFWELSWRTQLFLQISIVIFIFIAGVRIDYVTNPFGGILELDFGGFFLPGLLLVLFWVVVIMNSMNWIDGVDGLSGGIAFIGAVTIFFLSLKPEVNQPPMAIMSAALGGSLIAFLLFNFYPAKLMAGTSGSMFMGFILAVMAIFAGAKIATTLLVMAVPIIDAGWVVFERLRSGQSVFEADKRHLHHKLLELGWSHRKICLFFYAIMTGISAIALNTRTLGKAIAIILVAVAVGSILFYVNRKVFINRKKPFGI